QGADHQVALGRGALDLAPGASLQAQVLDHLVDVGLGDLGGVADHLELGHVDLAEVRHHLEGGDEVQAVLGGAVDARGAGQAQLWRTSAPRTSARTWSPKRCSITLAGTLPGRKPLMRAVRAISRRRPLTPASSCSAGRLKFRRRSRLPVDSTETCMWSLLLRRGGWPRVDRFGWTDSADILPACAGNALVWPIPGGRASIRHDAIDRRSAHSRQ